MTAKDDFNPFRDKTPTHELIKKRNEEQLKQSQKIIDESSKITEKIKDRHVKKYPTSES